MNYSYPKMNRNFLRSASPVLTLLAVCILAYGLLIPWLGYSYDEWHFIYYSTIHGAKGLINLFNYDGHPQATWFYLTSFRLLGTNPIAWHLFSLFWKAASVLMFWVLLIQIWPSRRRQVFTTSLLFALYPFFALQVFPIAYSEVWFSFFMLWLSFFLTIKAIQQPEKFWQWTILSILIKTGYIFSSEYTWFLELLRPLLIWCALPALLPITQKFRRTALIWIPYFLLFFASVIWRGFFYQALRKSLRVSVEIFSHPLFFIGEFARNLIPDIGLTLFSSWFRIFKPEYLDFSQLNNLVPLAVGIVGAAITYLYIKTEKPDQPDSVKDNWGKQTIFIGLIGVLCGLLPVWLTGYSMISSEWPINARFALAAFPGAALLLTLMIEVIISPRARIICIAIVTALLISYQFRAANDFRQVWEVRSKFYQQLTWRIPGLKPETVVILINNYLPELDPDSPALLALAPDFSVAMSLNAIYSAQPDNDGLIPYWYYTYPEFSTDYGTLTQPINFYVNHATLTYSSDSSNILALYFNPNQAECLRVIGPEYASYAKISPEIKSLAKLSNPQAILTDFHQNVDLVNSLIETGNNATWCYYYEKADLAAQQLQWESVVNFWKETRQKNLHTVNGHENLIFIKAFLETKDWEAASELTRETKSLSQGIASALCSLWVSPDANKNISPEQIEIKTRTIEKLQCGT